MRGLGGQLRHRGGVHPGAEALWPGIGFGRLPVVSGIRRRPQGICRFLCFRVRESHAAGFQSKCSRHCKGDVVAQVRQPSRNEQQDQRTHMLWVKCTVFTRSPTCLCAHTHARIQSHIIQARGFTGHKHARLQAKSLGKLRDKRRTHLCILLVKRARHV